MSWFKKGFIPIEEVAEDIDLADGIATQTEIETARKVRERYYSNFI